MIIWIAIFLGSQLVHGANLNFNQSKKLLLNLHKEYPFTLYCHCKYQGKVIDLKSCGYKVQSDLKRAKRLEFEHVVPAEAFGNAFLEWRNGATHCVKKGKPFKGRKCAETNPEFSRMEGDPYNLWPEIGELNGLRSNFSMAQISNKNFRFASRAGGCEAKLEDRKFEPEDQAKGTVARTYIYMHQKYPGKGIISDKNKKLFDAWDKMYPVSQWECTRTKKIEMKTSMANTVVKSRCIK